MCCEMTYVFPDPARVHVRLDSRYLAFGNPGKTLSFSLKKIANQYIHLLASMSLNRKIMS